MRWIQAITSATDDASLVASLTAVLSGNLAEHNIDLYDWVRPLNIVDTALDSLQRCVPA